MNNRLLFKTLVFIPVYIFHLILLLYWIVSIHGVLKPSPIIVFGSIIAIITTNIISNQVLNMLNHISKKYKSINFKEIKTWKKRFALELLILILTSATISMFLISKDAYSRFKRDRQESIILKIQDLQNNTYNHRFTFLNNTYNDFESYESFKSHIKLDKDTSYRTRLYRLLNEQGYFKEEYVDFNTFMLRFKECNIDSIDSQIESLQSEQDNTREVENYIDLFSILIVILIYPLRFLYFVVKWAFKTLDED